MERDKYLGTSQISSIHASAGMLRIQRNATATATDGKQSSGPAESSDRFQRRLRDRVCRATSTQYQYVPRTGGSSSTSTMEFCMGISNLPKEGGSRIQHDPSSCSMLCVSFAHGQLRTCRHPQDRGRAPIDARSVRTSHRCPPPQAIFGIGRRHSFENQRCTSDNRKVEVGP